jgi:hypothetical protein
VIDASGVLTVSAADGVLKNEFNPMNSQLTVELVEGVDPEIGTVTVSANGSFGFTAGPGFQGVAGFIYHLTYFDGNEAVNGAPVTVNIVRDFWLPLSVGLRSINFDGNAIIKKDVTAYQPYENPQWLDQNANGSTADAGDRQNPISFTARSLITLTAAFKVDPGMFAFWQARNGQIRVRATSQEVAPNYYLRLGFSQNIPLHPSNLGGSGLYMEGFVEFDNPFLDYTDYYPTLDLTWEISADGGQTWFRPFAGSMSSNQTYVTLDDPRGFNPESGQQKPVIYHTVFHAGISGAVGATNEAQLIQYIFAGFENRTIARADGLDLSYYQPWATTSATTASLIQTRNGACDAWASFYVDVLRAQGVASVTVGNIKVIAPVRANGQWDPWQAMVVKDWTFLSPVPGQVGNVPTNNAPQSPNFVGLRNAGWRWFNIPNQLDNTNTFPISSAQNNYAWLGTPAVVDGQGVPGQNSQNPHSLFGNHKLVQIGTTFFDPSYGLIYTSLQDFETRALDGFMNPILGLRWQERFTGFDVNNDGMLGNNLVNVLLFRQKTAQVGIGIIG